MSTQTSVVQGRNRKPRNGQMNVSKARAHRAWSTIHQTRIRARGPRTARIASRQHIVRTPQLR
jgi:hypothetical protein